MSTELIKSVTVNFSDGKSKTIIVDPENPETGYYRQSVFQGKLQIQEVFIAGGKTRTTPAIEFGAKNG